jgi:glycosyltransferase involved in cell wall biosynthesis
MTAPKYWFMQNRLMLEKYAKWYGIPKERLVYMPNCIEPEQFTKNEAAATEARKRMTGDKNTKIILFVGRLVRNKGVRELLGAFSEIRRQYPNTLLALIGTGSMEIELKGREGIFVPSRINEHEKLIPFYHASDIFALPTYYDSFPNTLLEAMACGLPCVSTPADGPQDVIENRKDGLIVPIGHTKELQEALLELLGNAILRKKFGEAAKEKVMKDYLWKNNAPKVYAVYRKLGKEFGL